MNHRFELLIITKKVNINGLLYNIQYISELFESLKTSTRMINNLESTSICDIKYKIVFLGNMSVGKSSIIERFINGNFD